MVLSLTLSPTMPLPYPPRILTFQQSINTLYMLYQDEATTVAEYILAYKDLMKEITGISELMLISFFINNLRPDIHQELLRRGLSSTLKETFALAQACEAHIEKVMLWRWCVSPYSIAPNPTSLGSTIAAPPSASSSPLIALVPDAHQVIPDPNLDDLAAAPDEDPPPALDPGDHQEIVDLILEDPVAMPDADPSLSLATGDHQAIVEPNPDNPVVELDTDPPLSLDPGDDKEFSVYPTYRAFEMVDRRHSDVTHHLSKGGTKVCLDYYGFSLLSDLQSSQDYATTVFGLSEITANLTNHARLDGVQDDNVDLDLKARLMLSLKIPANEYGLMFTVSRGFAFKLIACCYPFHTYKKMLTMFDYENQSVHWMAPKYKVKSFDGRKAQGGGGGLAVNKWQNGPKSIMGAGLLGATLLVCCKLVATTSIAQFHHHHEDNKEIVEWIEWAEKQYVFQSKVVEECKEAKTGSMEYADKIFDQMPHRDLVSWNALVCSFVWSRYSQPAFEAFQEMLVDGLMLSVSTWVNVILVCIQVGEFSPGKSLNGFAIKCEVLDDEVMTPTLVSIYACFNGVNSAMKLLALRREKHLVAWNDMLFAYTKIGDLGEACGVFQLTHCSHMRHNLVTLVSIPPCCCTLAIAFYGKPVHTIGITFSLTINVWVTPGMVLMYAQLGELEAARYFVNSMGCRIIAIVAAYGHYGKLYLITATINHVFLFHGSKIWGQSKSTMIFVRLDIDAKLIGDYKHVPRLWFLILLARGLIFSLMMSFIRKEEVQLPWWDLFSPNGTTMYSLKFGDLAELDATLSGLIGIFCVANSKTNLDIWKEGLDWAYGTESVNCCVIQPRQPCYGTDDFIVLLHILPTIVITKHKLAGDFQFWEYRHNHSSSS